MKKDLLWVIQNNFLCEKTRLSMLRSCASEYIDCLFVADIPFSEDLPKVPTDRKTIFYGSTNFINKVQRSRKWEYGIFSSPDDFSFERLQHIYGTNYLNYHAQRMSVFDFLMKTKHFDLSNQIFIKPDNDSKDFTGGVASEHGWFVRLTNIFSGTGTNATTTQIIVAEPKNIVAEYRFFVIKGQIISGSQYKHNGYRYTHTILPQDVTDFAKRMALPATPCPVYVLDIAQTKTPNASEQQYFVLEINGFNSSGFYDCDIRKIMTAINEYIKMI